MPCSLKDFTLQITGRSFVARTKEFRPPAAAPAAEPTPVCVRATRTRVKQSDVNRVRAMSSVILVADADSNGARRHIERDVRVATSTAVWRTEMDDPFNRSR